jgi:aminopeptidase
MKFAVRWSVAAIPSIAWAKKVFPALSSDDAVEALWNLIIKCSRADGDDPRLSWEAHKDNLLKRLKFFNRMKFKSLHFSNALGTDLTVELADGHIWMGGGTIAQDGILFFPNIPTEEVFTLPHRKGTQGRLVASKPLLYQGNLIEDIEIIFIDGKAVEWKASKNSSFLNHLFEIDEGSKYLGEIALVDNRSPVAMSNVFFFNTLFDKNSSCHIALGNRWCGDPRFGR